MTLCVIFVYRVRSSLNGGVEVLRGLVDDLLEAFGDRSSDQKRRAYEGHEEVKQF